MIEININEATYNFSEVNEGFPNEQIRRRQENGLAVCIRIRIKQDGLEMTLSCGECGGGGGVGRPPVGAEKEIFDLWNKLGCGGGHINPGKLIAFLNKVK